MSWRWFWPQTPCINEDTYEGGFTGQIIEWRYKGIKYFDENRKAGTKHGLQFYYYSNGDPEFLDNYVNGVQDGYQLSFYPNFVIDTEEWFRNGTEVTRTQYENPKQFARDIADLIQISEWNIGMLIVEFL